MRDAVKLAIAIGFAIGCGDSKTPMPSPEEPPAGESQLPLADVTAISVGGDHVCAVVTGGVVRCWGQNHFEQIGPADVAGDQSARPLQVRGLPAMVSVAAGKAHTCALAADGSVWCWGNNLLGESGNGSFLGGLPGAAAGRLHASTPVQVVGLTGPVSLIASASSETSDASYTCALMPDRTARCWGEDQIVRRTGNAIAPTMLAGVDDVSALAAGWYHACALSGGGTIKCWGFPALGGGDGDDESETPVEVAGLAGVTQIVAGSRHVCVLTGAGTVSCWGPLGIELGNGEDGSLTPVPVRGLEGVTMLAASGHQTCALRADGTVWCWGTWPSGDDWISVPVPASIAGVSGAIAVSVGYRSACARLSDGTVKCWGDDSDGALGRGSRTTADRVPTASVVVSGP